MGAANENQRLRDEKNRMKDVNQILEQQIRVD